LYRKLNSSSPKTFTKDEMIAFMDYNKLFKKKIVGLEHKDEIKNKYKSVEYYNDFNNEDELITNLDNLLADNKLQDIYANRALEFVTSKSGIVENYLNQLDKYIKPLTKVNF
jgi:hypothetical protein